MSQAQHDQGYYRRRFPRREYKRKVGILCDGTYFVCETGEIGEGGMSITSEIVLTDGHPLIVSFQIPGGDFVSLRATVRSTRKAGNHMVTHGLSFNDVNFSIKRQIRAFVSVGS